MMKQFKGKTRACVALLAALAMTAPTAAFAADTAPAAPATTDAGNGPSLITQDHTPQVREQDFGNDPATTDGTTTDETTTDETSSDRTSSNDTTTADGAREGADGTLTASADLTGLATIGVSWKQRDMTDAAKVPTLEVRYRYADEWSAWTTIPADNPDDDVTGLSPSYYVGDGDRAEARLTPQPGETITQAKLITVDSGYSADGIGTGDETSDAAGETGGTADPDATDTTTDDSTRNVTSDSTRDATRSTARDREPLTVTGRIHTREDWWVKGDPAMSWTPERDAHWKGAIVHHTVDRNDYTRAEVPALINGIYVFHNATRGWGDIGYQLLVDRFGGIWEGRDEGVPNRIVPGSQVVGAQAAGFNYDTFGVALIGSFHENAAPSDAMLDSASAAIAWEFKALGITDAYGTFQYKGTQARITGHGDSSHWSNGANRTQCPGQQVWNRMGRIRDVAAADLRYIAANRSTAHLDDVDWMMDKGFAQGYGPMQLFGGLRAMNRQDMAAFLYRLAGSPSYSPNADAKKRFADVNDGTPHAKEIWWLASTGITTGWKDAATGKATFRGDALVQRQDMAAFLNRFAATRGDANAAGWKPVTVDGVFPDVDASTPHHREVLWLASRGITTGFADGTFRGDHTVIRQDMAAFLHREMRYLGA